VGIDRALDGELPDNNPGGILCGHDFGHVDVARAVREVFGEPKLGPGERSQCWWVVIP